MKKTILIVGVITKLILELIFISIIIIPIGIIVFIISYCYKSILNTFKDIDN